jgi:hypothetical protein
MVLSYITHNTTQGTAATVPATASEATITGATATIYPNSYKRIIITATITVKSSATATAQNNTYKIKIGSTAVDTLIIANTVNGITGGLTTIQYVLSAVVEARAGGAVTVTHSGAAADAQVTSRFEDLIILGDS